MTSLSTKHEFRRNRRMIAINIEWEGPLTVETAKAQSGNDDYGVYQLYGRHPVYGPLPRTLVYIGKDQESTFRQRIHAHHVKEWVGTTAIVFVGRFAGKQQPTNLQWSKQIDEVEKLLIYAHSPAWNLKTLMIFRFVISIFSTGEIMVNYFRKSPRFAITILGTICPKV